MGQNVKARIRVAIAKRFHPRLVGAIILGPLLVDAQESATVDLQGTWSSTMTTPDEPLWTNEDLGCPLACIDVSYPYLRELLDSPANDERSLRELALDAWAYGARHLQNIMTEEGLEVREGYVRNEDAAAIACEPSGLFRTVLSPLPWRLTRHDDRLVMDYEEWGVTRTVYMDGRSHPTTLSPTLYGHSIGRFENGSLVIESTGIAAGEYWPQLGIGGHSDQVQLVERYTLSEDGAIAELELTVIDPVTLSEPLTYAKRLRRTPDVELLPHSCEVISGEP